MKGRWNCFIWALRTIPDPASLKVEAITIRPAEKTEEGKVLATASSAAAMDSSLGDAARELAPVFAVSVKKAFESDDPLVLVALHGSRMIGVSVYDPAGDAANHLLTGPCVLQEYGSRGIASWLLASSLKELRERGLEKARGVARDRSVLDKYIYRKFGGTAQPCEFPGPEPVKK